jgi:hypothetical protein
MGQPKGKTSKTASNSVRRLYLLQSSCKLCRRYFWNLRKHSCMCKSSQHCLLCQPYSKLRLQSFGTKSDGGQQRSEMISVSSPANVASRHNKKLSLAADEVQTCRLRVATEAGLT